MNLEIKKDERGVYVIRRDVRTAGFAPSQETAVRLRDRLAAEPSLPQASAPEVQSFLGPLRALSAQGLDEIPPRQARDFRIRMLGVAAATEHFMETFARMMGL